MRSLVLAVALLAGCSSDPAQFRPAKGARDLPSVKDAYRIQEVDPTCDEIGGVIAGRSVDDVATTAANHGGTHYRILNDFSHQTVETQTTGGYGYGVMHAQSSSEVVKHHSLVARVYRCN